MESQPFLMEIAIHRSCFNNILYIHACSIHNKHWHKINRFRIGQGEFKDICCEFIRKTDKTISIYEFSFIDQYTKKNAGIHCRLYYESRGAACSTLCRMEYASGK